MDKKIITYGSVCSGIEVAHIALKPLGFEPLWFSENADFPSKLLRYHYPDIPNYGDMMGIADKIRSVFGFSSTNVLSTANGGTGSTDKLKAATNLGFLSLANVTSDEKTLTSNTDLNTLTPDTYRSSSGTISATLVNAPPITNAGFRLIVSNLISSTTYVQTAIYNNATPTIYVRVCNSSGTWGEWKKLSFV